MAKQRTKKPVEDEDDNDGAYRMKRKRNNEAVKKSRMKSRMKEANNSEHVRQLKEENAELERKVETLKIELNLLKEFFVKCAAGGGKKSDNPVNTTSELSRNTFNNSDNQSFLDQIGSASSSASTSKTPRPGRRKK